MRDVNSIELINAVEAWWKMKKPLAWSKKQHLHDPFINLCGENEKWMVRALLDCL